MSSPRCLAFAVQVEELLHLFAVVDKDPVFRVVIIVEQRKNHSLHVAGFGAVKIRGVYKVESESSAVG